MIGTKQDGFRFENRLTGDQGLCTPYWQRALSSLLTLVNTLASSRNTGLTALVATGAVVAHGLGQKPKFVTLAPQDGTPSGVFADTFTLTSFTIHYTGGGTHKFGWAAET